MMTKNGIQDICSSTGKERDEETGYGYFGARYMDHELMTMWLSVDPLADKYPSISPYAYCAWNPVKLVDPDGREFCLNDDIVIKGVNNSSVTIKTNIVDVSINIDHDFGGNYVLEGEEVLSAALDLVGIVDPSGVCDGANVVLQAKNGEWGYAVLSAVGLIPYVGDIPKIGKIGKDIKILQKGISTKINSIKPSGWIEKASKKGDGIV
jgi:RHS repeat-associated protein